MQNNDPEINPGILVRILLARQLLDGSRMLDDRQLLERYARERAEDAFAELVQRHIALVYPAALRQAGGDVQRAEDVTQTVLAELARQAGKLACHPALTGWLYTATRRLALYALRGEARRSRRGQTAHAMHELSREPETMPDWSALGSVLDEAMHELSEPDRQALLLRYFAGHDFRTVGASLGLSDGAARTRVERALDKLRGRLARRGITSTASTLSALLMAHVMVNVHAKLAASAASAAFLAASAVPATLGSFISSP